MTSIVEKAKSGAQLTAIWFLLIVLASLLAYQLYQMTLLGGLWLSNSERFRPLFWNFTRLKWLGRVTGVTLVGGWIFFMAYLEGALQQWKKYNIVKSSTIRAITWLLGATLVSFLISQLFILTS